MAETRNPIEFEALLEHQHWMRGLARSLVLDDATVDDVVQQAWVAALNQPPRDDRSVRSWLATVVRNLSYRTYRDRERRQRREESAARPERDPRHSTEDVAERLELQRRMIDATLGLRETYREVVLLRYYEELSSSEIAHRLGIPAATVRTRLKRALEELRRQFDADFGDRHRWGMALLPLANLRPSSVTTAVATSTTASLSTWIGIGTLVMSSQKIIALVIIAVGIAVGAYFAFEQSEPTKPAASADHDVIAPSPIDPDAPLQKPDASPSSSADDERPSRTTDVPDETLGVRLHGRVEDASGVPIIAAIVTPAWPFEPVETDRQGAFEFMAEEFQGYGTYDVTVSAPGFARAYPTFWLQPGAEVDLGVIRLQPGGSITGSVIDESGLAVPDVEVRVHTPIRRSRVTMKTDASGRFSFDGLPIGFVRVDAITPTQRSAAESVAVAAGVEAQVELLLRDRDPSTQCRGIVLGPDGEPWPHAGVRIQYAGGTTGASADREGRFAVDVRPGVPLNIIARPNQPRPRLSAATSEVYAGDEPIVLQLAPSASIEIRCVDPDGEPVVVQNFSEFRQWSSGGRTSSSADVEVLSSPGLYRLYLPPTDAWIEVRSAQHADVDLGPFVPGTPPEHITVVMVPFPTLSVRVVSERGPISRARVTLHPAVAEDWSSEVNGFPVLFETATNGASTDETGLARISVDLDEHPTADEPRFVVKATADGYAPEWSETIRLADFHLDSTIDLRLSPGGGLEGRMILPDDEDPAGRYVAISCGDGEIFHANVGSDGAFSFSGLRPGEWKVREYFPRLFQSITGGGQPRRPGETTTWSCVVREGQVTRFDLDLSERPHFQVEGRVRINGVAPGPWRLTFEPVTHNDAIAREYTRGVSLSTDGTFSCESPYLGRYRVALRGDLPDGNRMFLSDRPVFNEGEQRWSYTADLVPLGGILETDDPTGRIAYRRIDGDLRVDVRFKLDDDGRFTALVPGGPGEITYRSSTEKTRVLTTIDLGSEGRTDLTLQP